MGVLASLTVTRTATSETSPATWVLTRPKCDSSPPPALSKGHDAPTHSVPEARGNGEGGGRQPRLLDGRLNEHVINEMADAMRVLLAAWRQDNDTRWHYRRTVAAQRVRVSSAYRDARSLQRRRQRSALRGEECSDGLVGSCRILDFLLRCWMEQVAVPACHS